VLRSHPSYFFLMLLHRLTDHLGQRRHTSRDRRGVTEPAGT
jgi:hypothetical protein